MGLRKLLYIALGSSLINLSGQASDFQEEVHVSVNSTNLLVGEQLFFSAFVYSNSTKKASTLSSVLYVELVNETGRAVFQTKIGLREGRGSGSLYVNPDWQSGTYRLISYTKWMRNYHSFHEQKLLTFNPYNGIILDEPIAGNPLRHSDFLWNGAETFAPLQQVFMNLGYLEAASLSISVQKAETLYFPNKIALDKPAVKLSSFEILPDYKYAVVQGKLKTSTSDSAKTRVNMTIKGSSMQVATTQADEHGRFWMKYNPVMSAKNAQVQVDGAQIEEMTIIDEYYSGHSKLDSSEFTLLDSITAEHLVSRSINGQIQHAYEKQVNTNTERRMIFSHPDAKIYYLDDYERFSSVRDTFIEYIYHVGVSKSEDNYEMNVRCPEPEGLLSSSKTPLTLLDGLKVNPQDILNQSPNDIEKVEILPEYYFLSDIVYKGVISVHTFERRKLDIEPMGKRFSLANYQPYSENSYSLNITDTYPLYEPSLFWQPIHTHPAGDLIFNFSTSRLEGDYKVIIAGITKNGKPINLVKYFQVSGSD